MIKITIEGPVGSGKSTIERVIRDYVEKRGLTMVNADNITEKALAQLKPDILVKEIVR